MLQVLREYENGILAEYQAAHQLNINFTPSCLQLSYPRILNGSQKASQRPTRIKHTRPELPYSPWSVEQSNF